MVYGAIFFLLALFGATSVIVRTISEHCEDILAALEGPTSNAEPAANVVRFPRRELPVRFEPRRAAA